MYYHVPISLISYIFNLKALHWSWSKLDLIHLFIVVENSYNSFKFGLFNFGGFKYAIIYLFKSLTLEISAMSTVDSVTCRS